MRAKILAAALILIGCTTGHQCLASQIELKPLTVVGNFEGKKGKTAVDISGISCLAPQGDKRTCLLVNDENRNAQFATFDGKTKELTVGPTVKLIGKNPSPDTLGTAPEAACKEGDDGFKDLDGEGVAYAEPYFYVVGSHGCSRGGDEFRLSSFILARVGSDPSHPGESTTTYRVSGLLQQAKAVSDYFQQALDEKSKGLNIEGIAASGGKLWFGLRAPVVGNQAYLVSGSIVDLFRANEDKTKLQVDVAEVDLGGLGIRDLAPLPDGRLLILAGPSQNSGTTYKLFVFDPAKGARDIGAFPNDVSGKAERLTVLDVKGDRVQFMVVFDALPNGAPQLGEVVLPN
jgi:hypothetical protein